MRNRLKRICSFIVMICLLLSSNYGIDIGVKEAKADDVIKQYHRWKDSETGADALNSYNDSYSPTASTDEEGLVRYHSNSRPDKGYIGSYSLNYEINLNEQCNNYILTIYLGNYNDYYTGERVGVDDPSIVLNDDIVEFSNKIKCDTTEKIGYNISGIEEGTYNVARYKYEYKFNLKEGVNHIKITNPRVTYCYLLYMPSVAYYAPNECDFEVYDEDYCICNNHTDEKRPHDFEYSYDTEGANCLTKGHTKRVCKRCGYTDIKKTPGRGHVYETITELSDEVDNEILQSASLPATSSYIYVKEHFNKLRYMTCTIKCQNCGEVYEESLLETVIYFKVADHPEICGGSEDGKIFYGIKRDYFDTLQMVASMANSSSNYKFHAHNSATSSNVGFYFDFTGTSYESINISNHINKIENEDSALEQKQYNYYAIAPYFNIRGLVLGENMNNEYLDFEGGNSGMLNAMALNYLKFSPEMTVCDFSKNGAFKTLNCLYDCDFGENTVEILNTHYTKNNSDCGYLRTLDISDNTKFIEGYSAFGFYNPLDINFHSLEYVDMKALIDSNMLMQNMSNGAYYSIYIPKTCKFVGFASVGFFIRLSYFEIEERDESDGYLYIDGDHNTTKHFDIVDLGDEYAELDIEIPKYCVSIYGPGDFSYTGRDNINGKVNINRFTINGGICATLAENYPYVGTYNMAKFKEGYYDICDVRYKRNKVILKSVYKEVNIDGMNCVHNGSPFYDSKYDDLEIITYLSYDYSTGSNKMPNIGELVIGDGCRLVCDHDYLYGNIKSSTWSSDYYNYTMHNQCTSFAVTAHYIRFGKYAGILGSGILSSSYIDTITLASDMYLTGYAFNCYKACSLVGGYHAINLYEINGDGRFIGTPVISKFLSYSSIKVRELDLSGLDGIVNLSNSVTDIGYYMGSSYINMTIFMDLPNCVKIDVSNSVALMNGIGTTPALVDLRLGSKLKIISGYFCTGNQLESLTLPESLKYLGSKPFEASSHLSILNLPSEMDYFGGIERSDTARFPNLEELHWHCNQDYYKDKDPKEKSSYLFAAYPNEACNYDEIIKGSIYNDSNRGWLNPDNNAYALVYNIGYEITGKYSPSTSVSCNLRVIDVDLPKGAGLVCDNVMAPYLESVYVNHKDGVFGQVTGDTTNKPFGANPTFNSTTTYGSANGVDIMFGSDIKYINACFQGTYIHLIRFEDGVREIRGGAFAGTQAKNDNDYIIDLPDSCAIMEGFNGATPTEFYTGGLKTLSNSRPLAGGMFNPSRLKKVVVENAKSVQQGFFANCSSLEDLDICGKVKSIDCILGRSNGLISLKNVTLHSGTREISSGVFSGANISNIELPDTLESIGQSCFQGCENIESIVIPSSINKILDGAFANCKLNKLIFEDDTSGGRPKEIKFGNYVFSSIALDELRLPNKIYDLGENIFIGGSIHNMYMSKSLMSMLPTSFAHIAIDKIYTYKHNIYNKEVLEDIKSEYFDGDPEIIQVYDIIYDDGGNITVDSVNYGDTVDFKDFDNLSGFSYTENGLTVYDGTEEVQDIVSDNLDTIRLYVRHNKWNIPIKVEGNIGGSIKVYDSNSTKVSDSIDVGDERYISLDKYGDYTLSLKTDNGITSEYKMSINSINRYDFMEEGFTIEGVSSDELEELDDTTIDMNVKSNTENVMALRVNKRLKSAFKAIDGVVLNSDTILSSPETGTATGASINVTEPDKVTTEPDNKATEVDNIVTEEPVVNVEEPVVKTKEPIKEPVVNTEEPVVKTKEPVVNVDKPVVNTEEPVISTKEPVVEAEPIKAIEVTNTPMMVTNNPVESTEVTKATEVESSIVTEKPVKESIITTEKPVVGTESPEETSITKQIGGTIYENGTVTQATIAPVSESSKEPTNTDKEQISDIKVSKVTPTPKVGGSISSVTTMSAIATQESISNSIIKDNIVNDSIVPNTDTVITQEVSLNNQVQEQNSDIEINNTTPTNISKVVSGIPVKFIIKDGVKYKVLKKNKLCVINAKKGSTIYLKFKYKGKLYKVTSVKKSINKKLKCISNKNTYKLGSAIKKKLLKVA